jgi:hypothetical protein
MRYRQRLPVFCLLALGPAGLGQLPTLRRNRLSRHEGFDRQGLLGLLRLSLRRKQRRPGCLRAAKFPRQSGYAVLALRLLGLDQKATGLTARLGGS